MATDEPTDHLWDLLTKGTPSNGTILSIKGNKNQIEEAKKLLESNEKLQGIRVFKW